MESPDTGDPDRIPGWEGWFCVGVLAVGLTAMFKDWAKTEFVMLGMVVTLVWAQILDLKDAIDGFSSKSLLAVMVLFAVAEGITQTGALDAIFKNVLGKPKTAGGAQVRMMIPVAFCSAFLNNTPVVALMIPILVSWSRSIKVSPAQLMIPLSYASELGGVCTLIGTSTNLIVKDLYDKASAKTEGLPTLSIFSQSKFGIPIAIMGMVYIVLVGRRILPGHAMKKDEQAMEEEPLQVGMLVGHATSIIAMTAEEAGLNNLDSLSLVHIVRDGEIICTPLLNHTYIQLYDELYFSGDMTHVDALAAQLNLTIVTDEYDIDQFGDHTQALKQADEAGAPLLHGETLDGRRRSMHSSRGLEESPRRVPPSPRSKRMASRSQFDVKDRTPSIIKLVHATIKDDAPIVGQSIRDVRFRSRFDAAVVHIRRGGSKLEGQLGRAVLCAGDELLMSIGATFDRISGDSRENFNDIRDVKAPVKQFMMPMTVPEGSKLIGKTIEEAGLRGLQDGFVATIQKGNSRVHAVSPDVRLQPGDIVWMAGNGARAIHTLRNIQGLEPQLARSSQGVSVVHRVLIQAVIASESPLIGKTLASSNFDEQFGCTVLALHREGERIMTSMDAVVLKTGDVVLVESGPGFVKEHEDSHVFALLSVIDDAAPTKWNRSIFALALLGALVVIQVVQSILDVDYIPLVASACAVVGAMLLSGCMNTSQVHKCLKWEIYLTVSAALGISTALDNTRVANLIANGLINLGKVMGGDISIQAAIYLATALLSNLIANNAAAALIFPIVQDISKKQGIPLDLLTFLLMFGASSAFMTPYGYQTNLMVQDVGGYSAVDFVKFGSPMQVWQAVVTIAVIAIPKLWYISWIIVTIVSVVIFVPEFMYMPQAMTRFKRHAAPNAGTQLANTSSRPMGPVAEHV